MRADNADVSTVRRIDATTGPVAVGGRTINLVSRSEARTLGPGGAHLFHLRARPTHVEVLDPDGTRHVMRVPDLERTAMLAIVGAAVACVVGIRARRRR